MTCKNGRKTKYESKATEIKRRKKNAI